MSLPDYVISFDHQREQIGEWCWGSCGHGLIGALEMDDHLFIGCNEKSCPHVDAELDARPVVIRKLKGIDDE